MLLSVQTAREMGKETEFLSIIVYLRAGVTAK
jgi:hypothetical protein